MLLADNYPFLGVLWSMLVFFLWVAWFILLFHIIGDVFRRRDASGAKKTLWLIFLLFVPFLGVFVYLITNSDDMAKRRLEEMQAAQSQMDEYVRTTAGSGGAAAEIEKAKGLLDSGAITQTEFEAIKAKALAPA
jgi:preprotein translocase subunit YajC